MATALVFNRALAYCMAWACRSVSGDRFAAPNVPLALLFFNVGIELGQLAFIALLVLVAATGVGLMGRRLAALAAACLCAGRAFSHVVHRAGPRNPRLVGVSRPVLHRNNGMEGDGQSSRCDSRFLGHLGGAQSGALPCPPHR